MRAEPCQAAGNHAYKAIANNVDLQQSAGSASAGGQGEGRQCCSVCTDTDVIPFHMHVDLSGPRRGQKVRSPAVRAKGRGWRGGCCRPPGAQHPPARTMPATSSGANMALSLVKPTAAGRAASIRGTGHGSNCMPNAYQQPWGCDTHPDLLAATAQAHACGSAAVVSSSSAR